MKKSIWCRMGWHRWSVVRSMTRYGISRTAIRYVQVNNYCNGKDKELHGHEPAVTEVLRGPAKLIEDRYCLRCYAKDFRLEREINLAIDRQVEQDAKVREIRIQVAQNDRSASLYSAGLQRDVMQNDLSASEYSAGLQRDLMRHDPPAGPDTDCTPQDHPAPAPSE